MTRWRVVKAPASRYLSSPRYAVLSDRIRGPVVGAHDGLFGWEIIPGARWQTFEEACQIAADRNGKQSTANMGPRGAAEGGEG